MNVYIAYKFKNISNREVLVADLEALYRNLKDRGFGVFLLGKEVQNWKKTSTPIWKTLHHILIHLLRSQVLLAVVTSDVSSPGLYVEMFLAKIFGKKVIVALKEGTNSDDLAGKTADNSIFVNYTSMEDLLLKLKDLIK